MDDETQGTPYRSSPIEELRERVEKLQGRVNDLERQYETHTHVVDRRVDWDCAQRQSTDLLCKDCHLVHVELLTALPPVYSFIITSCKRRALVEFPTTEIKEKAKCQSR